MKFVFDLWLFPVLIEGFRLPNKGEYIEVPVLIAPPEQYFFVLKLIKNRHSSELDEIERSPHGYEVI